MTTFSHRPGRGQLWVVTALLVTVIHLLVIAEAIGDEGPWTDYDSQATARADARRAYLTALFRAHEAQSLDGVLLACKALAGLGERAGVEQCVRVADESAHRSNNQRPLPGSAPSPTALRTQPTAGSHRIAP